MELRGRHALEYEDSFGQKGEARRNLRGLSVDGSSPGTRHDGFDAR